MIRFFDTIRQYIVHRMKALFVRCCFIMGYSATIVLTSCVTAIISFSFILFYVVVMNIFVNHVVLYIFIAVCLFCWLLHSFLVGSYFIFGIPPILKSAKHINSCIKINRKNTVTIEPSISEENLSKLQYYISSFPKENTYYLLFWLFLIFITVIIATCITNTLTLSFFKLSLIIYIITSTINFILTLILGEIFTGTIRVSCKKKLLLLKGSFEEKSYNSVKNKIYSLLIIFSISLYVSNTLMYYSNNKNLVFIFIILIVLLCLFITYLIIETIYNALKAINMFAYKIGNEEVSYFFTPSLDKEFININKSLRSANRTIIHYEMNLENTIKERTKQLIEQTNKLQEKDNILQTELNFAADIQKGIYPNVQNYKTTNLLLAYKIIPMGVVTGDYVDVFYLNNDNIGVIIADASGHGMPAALITIMAKLIFTDIVKYHNSPSKILTLANEQLTKFITTQEYMTCFFLSFNKDNSFVYSVAAHTHPILYKKRTHTVELLNTQGFIMGVLDELPIHYENKSNILEDGDLLILYTDGIIERKNINQIPYGMERLIECILQHSSKLISELIDIILDDVNTFANGLVAKDDYSIFIIGTKK